MNNMQRNVVLIFSIALALSLGLATIDDDFRWLIGASASIGIGTFIWAGRDKTEKPPDSE